MPGVLCAGADNICGRCGDLFAEGSGENSGVMASVGNDDDQTGAYTQNGTFSSGGSYGTGPYYNPSPNYRPAPRTNGMAVASLVLGVLSIFFVFCYGLGVILAILAIVFGAISQGAIKRSGGAETGSGYAVAGLVIGIVVLFLFMLLVFLIIFGVFAASSISSGILGNPGIQLPSSSSVEM